MHGGATLLVLGLIFTVPAHLQQYSQCMSRPYVWYIDSRPIDTDKWRLFDGHECWTPIKTGAEISTATGKSMHTYIECMYLACPMPVQTF